MHEQTVRLSETVAVFKLDGDARNIVASSAPARVVRNNIMSLAKRRVPVTEKIAMGRAQASTKERLLAVANG